VQIELTTLQTLVGTAMWTVARVAGIALTAPVFSTPTVPRQVRAAFVIMISIILIPSVQVPAGLTPFSASGLVVLASQVVIGAAMGFMLKLVVEAVAFGAQLIAFTMGLSFGSIVSPVDGTQSPILSQFYVLFAVLLLLATNVHLRLLAALAESFQQLPVGRGLPIAGLIGTLLTWSSNLFVGAMLVALPAMTALLVVNIGVGFTSRAAPALNLFAVGFPAILLLGIIAVWMTFGTVPGIIGRLFASAFAALSHMLVPGV